MSVLYIKHKYKDFMHSRQSFSCLHICRSLSSANIAVELLFIPISPTPISTAVCQCGRDSFWIPCLHTHVTAVSLNTAFHLRLQLDGQQIGLLGSILKHELRKKLFSTSTPSKQNGEAPSRRQDEQASFSA